MRKSDIKKMLGIPQWLPGQEHTIDTWTAQPPGPRRLCIYHRTGAGKTISSLACMKLAGETNVLVLAPPSAHDSWLAAGDQLGLTLSLISHAKFRAKGFKVSRDQAIIVDEFHLLGGSNSVGWKKLDRIAPGLRAPLIICSATPNYNDAERCYCVQHVLAPRTCPRGGYLGFIVQLCITRPNMFGRVPLVDGFLDYKDAEAYLASLPCVVYLPDTTKFEIVDHRLPSVLPVEFSEYGLNHRTERIMASRMEQIKQAEYHELMTDDGYIREDVYELLATLAGNAVTPIIVFAASSKIAEALQLSCTEHNVRSILVTGDLTQKEKLSRIESFRQGQGDILIGTATLATGTDGLDKVCDTMVILHDTPDAAMRRQLVGRILPRGASTDASNKQIFRIVI